MPWRKDRIKDDRHIQFEVSPESGSAVYSQHVYRVSGRLIDRWGPGSMSGALMRLI